MLKRSLLWKVKNVSHKEFILIISLIVGIGSGLIAVLIKNTVHNLGDFLRDFKLEVTCQGESIGFISKSKLFSNYRRKLVEFSEEYY